MENLDYSRLENTLKYLNSLSSFRHEDIPNDHLLHSLFESLSADGLNFNCETPRSRFLGEMLKPSDSQFVTYIILVMICILCAAAANGLTQGLLSLDLMEMKIKAQSGSPEEKIQAKRVLPIIKRHHLLLVSLMTWNASANEALPIFLDALVPGWLAIVLSVTIVLFVGEIIPAALLTGPNQLKLASSLVPVVWVVMAIFSPVAYPISLLLDVLVGKDHGLTIYSKNELATMVKLQQEEGHILEDVENPLRDSQIRVEEVSIIEGAIKFSDMLVRDIMTYVDKCFTLRANQKLDYQTLSEIFKTGYSRIPVWDQDPNDIIGIILTKDLIFIDPADETLVKNFVTLFGRAPLFVWQDQKLGEVLGLFKQTRGHMAIVRNVNALTDKDPFYQVVGLVTLEDIVEQIVGVDIEDEYDVGVHSSTSNNKVTRTRVVNFARLALLRPHLNVEFLTPEEVSVITSYLATEIVQVKQFYHYDFVKIRELVSNSSIRTLARKSKTPQKPEKDDVLIHQGKVLTSFFLVLNGKVTILVGKDKFHVEKGSWTVLGADVLTMPEGSYLPDFTAYITSDHVRVVLFYPFKKDTVAVETKEK